MKQVWLPDADRSSTKKVLKTPTAENPDAPPPPPPGGELPAYRIEQQSDAIRFVTLSAAGKELNDRTYTMDDREDQSLSPSGLRHISRTRWENGALVIRWRIEKGNDAFISGEDRWQLTQRGAVLRLDRRTEDAKSTSESVVIYRKAPDR